MLPTRISLCLPYGPTGTKGTPTELHLYISLSYCSFTVIFLCRFILNLRGVHIASDGTLTEEPLSALDFASHVIGNLGAPLHLGPLEDETTSDMSEMTSATAHGGGVEEIEDKGEIVEVSRYPVGMSSTDRPPDVTDAARANEMGSPPV